ncbi:MAG TPA: fructose-bisphosphatase class III [Kofleriaceae bacterium]|nr:fructose-bisphosphatase class III [Kofleriaceae bacterium]
MAKQYPSVDAALAALANLEAILTLPKMTVHVVSDVHGEDIKLRQVINNASGSLRPLLDSIFRGEVPAGELTELLAVLYYPRETWTAHGGDLVLFVARALTIIRELAKRYTIAYVERIIPDPLDPVLRELIFAPELVRTPAFLAALLAPFVQHGKGLELVDILARIVRDLAVGELVVAGDLGDRGPRLDKVIELLEHQPNVELTWGNHDADWLAATLGQPAAVATVVRLSLRYQRLAQLEEGFGISLAPLADLARDAYSDDPCERFHVKGDAGVNADLYARMQKAIAMIQFKLEGALFRRHPEWELEHRALLHRIDREAGTISLYGKTYPLLDTRLPTIDWADPYALTAAEQSCIDALVQSFVGSPTLWRQWSFVASRAQMWLRRDRCAIFHGCVPVDAEGNFLAFPVDGVAHSGRALFEALDVVIQRGVRERAMADLDLIFYLWTGPLSPCFGKDKMATFEGYFVADKTTQEEHKNPYFHLLHDKAFCARVLADFGVDPERGFIINGHVPVKLDAGETPIKKSGRAITIDGAFAAAYGDKGFSLVLDARRIYLAQHAHFDGPAAAVSQHADIVPTVSDVEVYAEPRTVADTELGDALREEISAIEALVAAFETNTVPRR